MSLSAKVLVRITQIDKDFINFQNSNAELLKGIHKGQLRVVEEYDWNTKTFWIRVTDTNGNKVMLMLSRHEIDYEVLWELPNG